MKTVQTKGAFAHDLVLWSLRHTVTHGWVWKKERNVTAQTADQWLDTFLRDEPGVVFRVSNRKPKSTF